VGETQNQTFQLAANASLRVDFQGSRVTSDGGLTLIRELDERLGPGELIEQYPKDSRWKNARLSTTKRQRVPRRRSHGRRRRCSVTIAATH
jgi:hypothetical protein